MSTVLILFQFSRSELIIQHSIQEEQGLNFGDTCLTLKVPGTQVVMTTNQGSVAEDRALSVKSSSYETKVELGPQLLLDSKTRDIPVVKDTTIICFPQVLSE